MKFGFSNYISRIRSLSFNPILQKKISSSRKENLLEKCPYSTFQKLPKLPVPTLSLTGLNCLNSVKPLLNEVEYIHITKLIENLIDPNQTGHKLQKLLEEKASNSTNWLEDWWINYAYLENRQPTALYINPGIYMPHTADFDNISVAAKLIRSILDYKIQIDNGTISIDKLGSDDLCMKQFYRILGCCRIPGETQDNVEVHVGGAEDSPTHIIVMSNNHIFSLKVYDNDGEALSLFELKLYLEKIVLESKKEVVAPIGILTSLPRNNWFSIYSKLSKNENNQKIFTAISRSIFVLCLDKLPSSNGKTSVPNKETIRLNEVLHGNLINSSNRWFDKVLQAIVSPDGHIGFNYEHSTAEGPPIIRLIDYCYQHILEQKIDDFNGNNVNINLSNIQHLNFENVSDIQDDISIAEQSFKMKISDLNLIFFKFDNFGKELLKKCRISPDAFIQMAFQLAYYKIHKEFVFTYETGSLRKFMHGRTDTIQSCSEASCRYCRAVVDNENISQQREWLIKAINAHRKQTDEVINGRGIYRHLLGLKLIGLENNISLPSFYLDYLYEKITQYKISTSQVPSKNGGLVCFSPVVPDGYGICYNPMDDCLLFSISTWQSWSQTNSLEFAKFLSDALIKGASLLNQGSKL